MAEQAVSPVDSIRFVPVDHPLGSRISVVGGGGKSTVSRAIAAKLAIPYIELDALFWKPDWQESTTEEMQAKTAAALDAAPDGWVADGHYWSRLGDIILGSADTVVWVNPPWRVMWWRVVRRSFRRSWDRQKICGENYESWRRTLSTGSLWWWHIRNRSHYTGLGGRMAALVPAGTPVIRLRTAHDVRRFHEAQGLWRR